MAELEVIVALVPDNIGVSIAKGLNAQLMDQWQMEPDPPVVLCGSEHERNSIPHMTMLQMYLNEDKRAELEGRMNRISARFGPRFHLQLEMSQVRLWGSGWMFWFPDEDALKINGRWRQFRGVVLDHADLGLPRLRSRNHPVSRELTREELWDWDRYGYAHVHMPHITVGCVRPDAALPITFPTQMDRLCPFPRLVLGRRGPRGTIAEILHEVHIGA